LDVGLKNQQPILKKASPRAGFFSASGKTSVVLLQTQEFEQLCFFRMTLHPELNMHFKETTDAKEDFGGGGGGTVRCGGQRYGATSWWKQG